MKASDSPTVGDVFELLNRWRHLPFYSLETRAAPFFGIFLRDVLRARFGTEIHETVIPEFPLRIHTLYNADERKKRRLESSPGHSNNVDYVAFDKDIRTAYLVELKTDMGSVRDDQNEYLCAARRKAFPGLVEGVAELAKGSDSKRKYVHLLHLLAESGLISVPKGLYEKSFGRDRVVSGWTEEAKGLEIGGQKCSKTKVVFIQPRPNPKPTKNTSKTYDFQYIYFDEVANIVQRHGDLGCIFANFLRQWVEEAGSPNPRDIHRS